MDYKFYAFLNRMKFINRWSLMRNTRTENVAEHSHQVAIIAHCLATIEKVIFKKNVSADRAATIALFHETAEVITGDLPTPIKYFNKDINKAYKDIERQAEEKLLSQLPLELQSSLTAAVQPSDSLEKNLVKYADKLAAFIKCIEEKSSGNVEFDDAYILIENSLIDCKCDSVDYFMTNFIKAFYFNLDLLSKDILKQF